MLFKRRRMRKRRRRRRKKNGMLHLTKKAPRNHWVLCCYLLTVSSYRLVWAFHFRRYIECFTFFGKNSEYLNYYAFKMVIHILLSIVKLLPCTARNWVSQNFFLYRVFQLMTSKSRWFLKGCSCLAMDSLSFGNSAGWSALLVHLANIWAKHMRWKKTNLVFLKIQKETNTHSNVWQEFF